MKELIELLNNTDGDRLVGYAIFIIIALGIIVDGIYYIVKALRKNK